MSDTINNELIFNFPEEKDTFHHLIALGDKSKQILKHLKIDLGKWFNDELLTINKGCEDVRNLLVIADDNADISELPKEYTDREFISQHIFVFDISGSPRPDRWNGVFSYLWIPPKKQYTTIKHLFQMYYHDILSMSSLICFDFNDWKISVRGKNSLSIHKISITSDLKHRLCKLPISNTKENKYVIIEASPSFKDVYMAKLMKSVNCIFNKLGDDSMVHWTILGKELPRHEAYISIMEFKPL